MGENGDSKGKIVNNINFWIFVLYGVIAVGYAAIAVIGILDKNAVEIVVGAIGFVFIGAMFIKYIPTKSAADNYAMIMYIVFGEGLQRFVTNVSQKNVAASVIYGILTAAYGLLAIYGFYDTFRSGAKREKSKSLNAFLYAAAFVGIIAVIISLIVNIG